MKVEVIANTIIATLAGGAFFAFQYTGGNTPRYALALVGVAGAVMAYATFHAVAAYIEGGE